MAAIAITAATKRDLLLKAEVLFHPIVRFCFAIMIAPIKMTRKTSARLLKQISLSTFE